MSKSLSGLLALLLVVFSAAGSRAADYVEPVRPAKNRLPGVSVGPAPAATGKVQVPIITWGGDAASDASELSGSSCGKQMLRAPCAASQSALPSL